MQSKIVHKAPNLFKNRVWRLGMNNPCSQKPKTRFPFQGAGFGSQKLKTRLGF